MRHQQPLASPLLGLGEIPAGLLSAEESQPTTYWFSTLPAHISLTEPVHRAKHRWIIERDYEVLT